MKQLTDLGNEIFIVEELIESALCQHILQITEQFEVKNAGIELQQINQQIRSNSSLSLDDRHPLLKSTNDLLLSKIAVIQKLLLKHYGVAFPHAETCTILRYQSGEFYRRHVDNLLLQSRFQEVAQGVPTRDVSIVGYLNEECEGGETYFDRQNLKVKPKTGDVLIFPSFWTHPHLDSCFLRLIIFPI